VTPQNPGGTAQWVEEPRWYLWDGGFLLIGRSVGLVPPHEHHAIQIVVGVEGQFAVAGKDDVWQTGRGLIVRPDVEHSFNPQGVPGAMLFVDPESTEGLWLRSSLSSDITIVPPGRLDGIARELRTFVERPFEALEVGELIRHTVKSLTTGAPPSRKLDQRITVVLKAIRASDDLRIPIEKAASMAFLSPSRFAHLFKQQVGLPFRRYMLWRKLTRAMLAIGREGTIAAGAHAADFADAAHLTRTFQQMFGIPPSALMRGQFFEIPPPFESPGA
jgi:AraC family transcriptional regulator